MSCFPVYCGRCRKQVDRETFNFWQGTAWCNSCRQVVTGSYCKVPMWVFVVIGVLFIKLQLN